MATRGKVVEVSLAETKANDRLTPDEVAELCGMTHSRVCQLLRSGEMKGEKGRGGWWEVPRKEAEKFSERPIASGRPRVSESEGA